MIDRNPSFERMALDAGFENMFAFSENGFEITMTDEADMTEKLYRFYKLATRSVYSFERTELRVMQAKCDGDNEQFLNMVSNLIGSWNEELEALKQQASPKWNQYNCPFVDQCHRID